ncbi:hypothetical protein Taro_035515 [Colocasia esculenta]|uniref:Uncharacterized protein n=1 Tax=Colocasia esculenta TaxID=4460 RepID=A0A843WAR3_COLES|nr:hypothetical protein [Colocasia esculenta]
MARLLPLRLLIGTVFTFRHRRLVSPLGHCRLVSLHIYSFLLLLLLLSELSSSSNEESFSSEPILLFLPPRRGIMLIHMLSWASLTALSSGACRCCSGWVPLEVMEDDHEEVAEARLLFPMKRLLGKLRQVFSPGSYEGLMVSKTEYTHIRGKPFLIWEQMDLICSSSMASGHLASSFVAQENSHPSSQYYQQDVSDDYEIDLDLNTSRMGLEDDALNFITQQPPVKTNDEATSHSKDIPCASTSSRKHKYNSQVSVEAFDKLLELGEERLKLTRELVENQRRTIPPQVDVALQELLKVEGIPQHYLYKVINLLKDKDDRCIFLALPN